jgi:iron complex outermembrane receptor protein
VPWNYLIPAGQTAPGGLTGNSDLQTYLFPYYHSTGRTKEVDYSANVSGSVFALPAGDLAIAAGYEHRNESGSFYPDALQVASLSTNLPGGPTSGKYKVDEYYVEVDVPVLKDLPLARELSFNVAGRYSKYDTFGDTTNGKFSLTWKPIDDLLVRANYAQGFRAPSISDLYGGISGTFPYYTDPCDTTFGAAVDNLTVLGVARADLRVRTPRRPISVSRARVAARAPARTRRVLSTCSLVRPRLCSRKRRPARPPAWSTARAGFPVSI